MAQLKRGLWLSILLILVVPSLSACRRVVAPLPSTATSTPRPSETALPPTATATETPEPTVTATPTEVPTPIEMPGVRLSMDIDNPASVPWEDLLAGRIEPAGPVVFADDAQFETEYNEDGTVRMPMVVHNMGQWGMSYFYTQPHYDDLRKRPVQIVGFGRTTDSENGMELGVVLEAVHNRDGSIGRWTFLVEAEYMQYFKHQLMDGEHYMIPTQINKPSRDGSNIKILGSSELHTIVHRTAPDLIDNLDEFVKTGVWTTEMDQPMAGQMHEWTLY